VEGPGDKVWASAASACPLKKKRPGLFAARKRPGRKAHILERIENARSLALPAWQSDWETRALLIAIQITFADDHVFVNENRAAER
jgi:hypothetical protein